MTSLVPSYFCMKNFPGFPAGTPGLLTFPDRFWALGSLFGIKSFWLSLMWGLRNYGCSYGRGCGCGYGCFWRISNFTPGLKEAFVSSCFFGAWNYVIAEYFLHLFYLSKYRGELTIFLDQFWKFLIPHVNQTLHLRPFNFICIAAIYMGPYKVTHQPGSVKSERIFGVEKKYFFCDG